MASTPSTTFNPTNGTVNDFQMKSFRSLGDGSAASATTPAGDFGYNAVSTATTTLVKTGAGQLHQVIVLGGTLGAITVYDALTATNPIAPTFTPVAMTGSGPQVYTFDVTFGVGLTIVTAAATALTVTYR